jgi:DNA-binding response OmpR family regulator
MTTTNALADPPPSEPSILSAGNIHASMARYQASVAGKPIDLTYKEFELLRLLLSSPDRILSYDDLVRVLWPEGGQGARLRLGVVVCRLRAKLAGSHPYRIQTVRHRGYGLTATGGGEL